MRLCPSEFIVLSGDDPTAVGAMRVGARGVISVTANVVPRTMHRICAAALAGRFDEAVALDRSIALLHQALFVEPNPIPVKWALERMGRIAAGIRLPLTPLSRSQRGAVEDAMRAAGIALG